MKYNVTGLALNRVNAAKVHFEKTVQKGRYNKKSLEAAWQVGFSLCNLL